MAGPCATGKIPAPTENPGEGGSLGGSLWHRKNPGEGRVPLAGPCGTGKFPVRELDRKIPVTGKFPVREVDRKNLGERGRTGNFR